MNEPTKPSIDTQKLEHDVIVGAAQLLASAMKLAQAQNDPAMLRRAEMLHEAQGLVPVLTITCPHGDPGKIAVSLDYADPDSGSIKVQLFALTAQAETVQ